MSIEASLRALTAHWAAARPAERANAQSYLIDFGFLDESGAATYPVLYDLVRARVKPHRETNKRAAYRHYWWRLGEPRRELREALAGLERYIATVYVAKHRFFTVLDADAAPDDTVICIASDDSFHLAVLSSSIHVV